MVDISNNQLPTLYFSASVNLSLYQMGPGSLGGMGNFGGHLPAHCKVWGIFCHSGVQSYYQPNSVGGSSNSAFHYQYYSCLSVLLQDFAFMLKVLAYLLNKPPSISVNIVGQCAFSCFDTVGHQEEHLACKKSSDEVLVCLSVWSEVQFVCILSSQCQCIPKPVISRLI